jgi:hypothetical protein
MWCFLPILKIHDVWQWIKFRFWSSDQFVNDLQVKEIQEESIASYASKPLEVTQAGAGSDLAQRLKEIHDVKKSDQEGSLLLAVFKNFISLPV